MTNIEYLRKLTDELPAFPRVSFEHNAYKELAIENGVCRIWDLYWTPQISITRFYVSGGSTYHNHKHEGIETIYVTSGKMVLDFDDGRGQVVLTAGLSYYIESDTIHRAHYPEDCFGIVVVVPAEVVYRADKT